MTFDPQSSDRASATAAKRLGLRRSEEGIPRWFSDGAGRGLGFWQFRRFRYLIVVGVLVAIAFCSWLLDHQPIAFSLFGIAALTGGFRLGTTLLRRVLSPSRPISAVARTVVEEALSTKLSVFLVVLVLVSLPVFPLLLDPKERLAYRVQFFLSWSLSSAGVLLSLLSIAIACRSVSDDIESNRIHMAFSKPLSRWEYLGGKWLGISLLNALLVSLLGITTYAFTIGLASSAATDAQDRLAVDEQVLTARSVALPRHPRGDDFDRSVEATIEQIRADDPVTFDKDPTGARRRIYSQHIHEWHTVTPDIVSSFVFDGLDPNSIRAPVVQLRLKPWANNSGISEAEVRFALWLNERPFPIRNGRHTPYTVRQGTVQTIDVPTSFIDSDNRLKVTVANQNLVMPGEDFATSISLTPDDGMQVLYRVGGFAMNFCRGLLVLWTRLLMLTAAALAAATWLGFPTAFLASLMVYVSAAASGFFADAVDIYTGLDRKTATLSSMFRLRFRLLSERVLAFEWWEAMKTVGSYVADAFLSLIPSFANYDSVGELATGRLVPLMELGSGILVLALAYPAVLLGLGCVLLNRRDLIRTSS